MVRIGALFFLLIGTGFSNAQNLVPNYSFEVFDTCPSSTGKICNAIPWFQPFKLPGGDVCVNSSSDYYNQCYAGAPPSLNVPGNFAGYQMAKTGVGYSGVLVFIAPPANEYREYIEVKLTDSLLAGKKYCVEFYVSLANTFGYATDAIGAYLSKDTVLRPDKRALPCTPQIINPSGNFLTDTSQWMLISDTFIAGGGGGKIHHHW